MHASHATLLSLVIPLAMTAGSASPAGQSPKASAAPAFVVPSEIMELAKSKRRFDQEDIQLVTRVMHRGGVDDFVLKIDPNSGDVSVNTETKSTPHLDIKPGSCPNPLPLRGPGAATTVSTGVLGNGFDVTQVALDSVRLQRPPPAAFLTEKQVVPSLINLADVGTPFDGGPCECAAYGPDGILDINVHYNKADVITILELADETPGSSVPLQVVGLSKDNESIFAAVDCVRIQR